MTRPTHRPTSMFAATAADLPLFSGTPQSAPAQVYAPKEQPQQDSMFDRREYINGKEYKAPYQGGLSIMDTIDAYLDKHGSATLVELQSACKCPRSKYGNTPDTNPVNAALVKLRELGQVKATNPQWGEPTFSPVKCAALAPETNTEARQQMQDDDD